MFEVNFEYICTCSGVSIVNFEQVIAGWERTEERHPKRHLNTIWISQIGFDFCYLLQYVILSVMIMIGKKSSLKLQLIDP